jgi:hypothetical protein
MWQSLERREQLELVFSRPGSDFRHVLRCLVELEIQNKRYTAAMAFIIRGALRCLPNRCFDFFKSARMAAISASVG